MSCATTTAQRRRPFTGQQRPVHTQPFAFRAPPEDDESVKMSNTTRGRSSAPSPALIAGDATRFLVANISTTFAVRAASSRVPPFSALGVNSQPRRRESPSAHHSSAATRRCISNRNTLRFRKSANPCKQRRNDFLTATNITTSRYSARPSGVGCSALFGMPGSRGTGRESCIGSCASPITTQQLLITTHGSLLTKTRRIL